MSGGVFQFPVGPVWRCVRTKPKCEHIAARQLRMLGDGVEVFCPRLRHLKILPRGRVWFTEALFPTYIFARCDWSALQRQVLSTTGVSGLVHFGSLVPELRPELIAELRTSFSDDEIITVQVGVEVGEDVEIAEGPLRGATGRVTHLLPARDRVRVLLEFLGQSREIEVPLLSVLSGRSVRQAAAAAGV